MKSIPMILVALRAAIAPFLLWDAIDGAIGLWFIIGYLIGFFQISSTG